VYKNGKYRYARTDLDSRGRFFVHFFRGKFWGKFRGKFSPQKCWGKGIFRGKSFEKLFFQKIPQNFPRKFFLRKIGPRFILNRMLFLVGLKLQPLLLDSSLNGVDNVIANIFEAR
jgi:hypothetical protein